MAARSAQARWEGTLKEGTGTLTLASGSFEGNYSFSSRFEDGGTGTNPEELIAAAHAGCFSMQLNNDLRKEGYEPVYINAKSVVNMKRIDEAMTIYQLDIIVDAEVPNISEEEFTKVAKNVEETCIISRALNAEFTLDVTLNN